MKAFKDFVLQKFTEWNITDTDNIYFSQIGDFYYAEYIPLYPNKTNGDFTITQHVYSGKTQIYGNFGALIPTIAEL